ncbi:DUF1947 domain-containing protein [Candidatus Woesearchaeota archaeon]|nr:MAG: DUF1947 domain-containing protein [Candidatus Woesearchaeota archaeon]
MRQLRKSDIRKINEQLTREYEGQFSISPKSKVIAKEIEEKGRKTEVLVIDGKPSFFFRHEKIFPTLNILVEKNPLKRVTVDMGAVKFVVNGADIMRPGVVGCDETVTKEEPVCIVDETHGKPLAVGIALFDAGELLNQTKGKVVANLHYAGDKIWNAGEG